MPQPEATFKRKIQRKLKELVERRAQTKCKLRVKLVWNAGTGFGVARLDCDGVINGRPVVIEVKAPGGSYKLTGRQRLTMREYEQAGAHVFLIDSDESLQTFLNWVDSLE